MNLDELQTSLRDLHAQQKDNLKKRRTLIKEMKSIPYQRNYKRSRLNEETIIQGGLQINLEGSKQSRDEKQKQLDQQVPNAVKERTKRIVGLQFMGYLQKAKVDLAKQEDKLNKQKEINMRLCEKDKNELEHLKETHDKRKDQLQQERREVEKLLAADEFKRQNVLIDLQFKTMEQFFITKAHPHILWKPTKTNEGMATLREYSQQTFNQMMKDMKDKLNTAFQAFTDQQQQLKVADQTEQVEHVETSSDSEESKPKEVGQE